MLRRFVLPFGFAFMVLSSAAHAQESVWRPIVKQCAEVIDREAGCASCGSMWPQWMRCAVPRIYGNRVPPAKLEACMQQIWDRRWEQKTCAMCGDPVRSVIECIGGHA